MTQKMLKISNKEREGGEREGERERRRERGREGAREKSLLRIV